METKNNHIGKTSHFILWRGIFLVLFGASAILWTGSTLSALILVFGVFALVDGFVLIVMHNRFGHILGPATLWFGIVSLLIGLCTLLYPSTTALVFAIFIALRAFIGGVLEFKMATHLRKHITGEVLLMLSGILSIIFSIALTIILITYPVLGLLLLTEIIGLYALCLGIIFFILFLNIKKFTGIETAGVTEVF